MRGSGRKLRAPLRLDKLVLLNCRGVDRLISGVRPSVGTRAGFVVLVLVWARYFINRGFINAAISGVVQAGSWCVRAMVISAAIYIVVANYLHEVDALRSHLPHKTGTLTPSTADNAISSSVILVITQAPD